MRTRLLGDDSTSYTLYKSCCGFIVDRFVYLNVQNYVSYVSFEIENVQRQNRIF